MQWAGPTVWYSFTPSEDTWVEANTFGSDYDTTLSAYTGSRGSLVQIACNDDSSGLQSRIGFQATAGVTYYFMVGAFASGSGGNLVFWVGDERPAPLTIEVDITSAVANGRAGLVTISGTVTCSRPTSVDLYASVTQSVGRRALIHGWGYGGTYCEDEAPFAIQVTGDNGRFTPGKADVRVIGLAYDPFYDTYAYDEATVTRLRGR